MSSSDIAGSYFSDFITQLSEISIIANLHFITTIFLFLVGILVGFVLSYLFSLRKRDHQESDERRRLFEGGFDVPSDITHIKEWTPNSRHMLLFRQQFIPGGYIRGVIGICHGFGDHSHDFMTELAVEFCHRGFAVISMDAEGHGLSDGLHAHVEKLNDIVADFADYFDHEMETHDEFKGKPLFVYGESMGGAVAFNLCTASILSPKISGCILVAPMVDVSPDMKLPAPITFFLRHLARLVPLAPITPVPDIIDQCYSHPAVRKRARNDKLLYQDRPRLGSAVAMLEGIESVCGRLSELEHPVLIAHGQKDVVTSPIVSQKLFDECRATDKKLNLYPDSWHGLMRGEVSLASSAVFSDVMIWLDERTKMSVRKSPRKRRALTTPDDSD